MSKKIEHAENKINTGLEVSCNTSESKITSKKVAELLNDQESRPVEELSEQSGVEAVIKVKTKTGQIKSKSITLRVTQEQYAAIKAKCRNAHGEELLTVAEFVRQAALTQHVVKPREYPLERFRLAVAGQMAMGITEIVQLLDEAMDKSDGAYSIYSCLEIMSRIEQVQNQVAVLLAPLADIDFQGDE